MLLSKVSKESVWIIFVHDLFLVWRRIKYLWQVASRPEVWIDDDCCFLYHVNIEPIRCLSWKSNYRGHGIWFFWCYQWFEWIFPEPNNLSLASLFWILQNPSQCYNTWLIQRRQEMWFSSYFRCDSWIFHEMARIENLSRQIFLLGPFWLLYPNF